jgi:hypothetical protein
MVHCWKKTIIQTSCHFEVGRHKDEEAALLLRSVVLRRKLQNNLVAKEMKVEVATAWSFNSSEGNRRANNLR